jgi:hypothetical protein
MVIVMISYTNTVPLLKSSGKCGANVHPTVHMMDKGKVTSGSRTGFDRHLVGVLRYASEYR